MPIIHFINEQIRLEIPAGETLLQAQIRAGLQPDAPCGGKGSCGKCAVRIREAGSDAFHTVLACQTRVQCDLELHTICTEANARVLTEGVSARSSLNPQIEIENIHVESCRRGESTSDWDRFKDALNIVFGTRAWRVNLPLASLLGERIRTNDGNLTAVVCGDIVLDAHTALRRHAMIAFDVGTTSIAGYLIDVESGATLARAGMLNPQRQFGADVIQRADHALAGGMDDLTNAVRGAIDDLAGQLCASAGIDRDEIYAASCVGNSCMHHLLLGVSPASLSRAPYNPAVSEAMILDSSALNLRLHAGAPVLMPPVIAGFVGADTVGCLLAGHWESIRPITLMIDIGTNGEIVLGNASRRIACSTAAGPAFEGAKISCGMRGGTGAIDHVWIDQDRVQWHVIGDGQPTGICGSGLIDLVSVLLQTGEIDESGRLTNGSEYRLGDTAVTLTQKDIREVQLAKAAICAGIRLMAGKLGIQVSDVAQVCIAGAFGSFMNPESALNIGLLPPELRRVPIAAVGNAAGEGACMVLKDRGAWAIASDLAKNTEFLELATIPDFQDEFIDALEFDLGENA